MSRRKLAFLLTSLLLALLVLAPGKSGNGGAGGIADSPSLRNPGNFPRVMAFRTSLGDVINADGTSGGPVRPMEDLDDVEVVLDKNQDFIKAVEAEYGNRVVTLWHRGWGNIGRNRLTADRVALASDPSVTIYPGHWLFEVGTTVADDIDGISTFVKIYVEDNSNFATAEDAMIHYWDPSGGHDWSRVEHVLVRTTGTDARGSFVKVRRSFPLSWTVGSSEVRLAPHATIFGTTSWAVNLSIGSPEDGNGREGWEFFADFLHGRWLSDLCSGANQEVCPDGIEFDGARWLPNNQGSLGILIDANNDNEVDYGYVDGIQVYGLGGIQSVIKLREKLPHEYILADSSTPAVGYRGFSAINGIEMENFPETNRTRGTVNTGYLTGFSSAFNHLRQWVENVVGRPAFSYGFTKHYSATFGCDGDAAATNSEFRIGLASDLMVGMPHPYASEVPGGTKCFNLYNWDEYFGGSQGDWDWLGQPRSVAVRVLDNLDGADLLGGVSWVGGSTSCALGGGGVNSASFAGPGSEDQYELQVSNVCDVPTIAGAFIQTEAGDVAVSTSSPDPVAYTVRFDASSVNTYGGDPAYDWAGAVPRLLRVSLVLDNSTLHQDIQLPADGTVRPYYLTFMDVPRASKREIVGVRFESGEETGRVTIGSPQLFKGSAERWVRYFKNGAVFLNATHDDWEMALAPSGRVPGGYGRLDGTQDPLVNTGTDGSGPLKREFVIPAEDALLVIKNR